MKRKGGEEKKSRKARAVRGEPEQGELELNNCYLYLVISNNWNGSGGRSAWRRLVPGPEGLWSWADGDPVI